MMNLSEYHAMRSGGLIAKVKLRILTYLIFPLKVVATLLTCRKTDTVVTTTNPFYLPLIAITLSRIFRYKTISVIYDLYPDALEQFEVIAKNGIISKLLGISTKGAFKGADATVFLGERIRIHAEERWGNCRRSEVIELGANTDMYSPELNIRHPLNIHYGGLAGVVHDIENLALCFTHAREKLGDTVFISCSTSGPKSGLLRELAAKKVLEFHTPLSSQAWSSKIAQIGIGVVCLLPEASTISLPSKTYSLLAAGVPVLGICPSDSDLGQLILKSGAGWVIENQLLSAAEIAEQFSATIHHLLTYPEELITARVNARKTAENQFSIEHLAARWHPLIQGSDFRTPDLEKINIRQ